MRGAAVVPIEDDDEAELEARSEPMVNLIVRVPKSYREALKALAAKKRFVEADVVRLILKSGIRELEQRWGVKGPKA